MAAPWLRIGRWWLIAISLVGIAWMWRYGVTLFVHPSPDLGIFPIFVAATQLPGMLDEFALGLLLARFVRSDAGKKLMNLKWFSLIIFIVSILFLAMTMSIYWRFAAYWNYSWMVTVWRTLLAISFALVLLFAASVNITGILRVILFPFFYLGTISYGIYLWHLPVLLSLKKLTWISPSLALALGLLFASIFASVSWHFFEKPILARLPRTPFKNSI